MDKEEFRIKLEEINSLVEKKDYQGAMSIVDSVDWRRVKSVRTLCVVGEIYAANKKYEESREIFLLAYHRAPIGKNILYRLIEVAIKLGNIDEALEYYSEYLEAAPNDNTRFLLKYKIYHAKKAPLDEQIAILEEYKEKEYTERWSYELAKLYYQAGQKEKCIDTCDDMILWFSEGKYVDKSLELKMRMTGLTPSQKEKYQKEVKLKKEMDPSVIKVDDVLEEETESEENGPDIGTIRIPRVDERTDKQGNPVNPILESTGALQEKIVQGLKDIFGSRIKIDDFNEVNEDALEKKDEEQIEGQMSIMDVIPKEKEEHPEEAKILEPENVKPTIWNKIPALEEEKKAIAKQLEKEKIENVPALEPENTEVAEPTIEEDPVEEVNAKEIEPEEFTTTQEDNSGMTKDLSDLKESIKETKEKMNSDFNLEDIILSAAVEQNIEIPEDKPEEQPEESAEDESEEIKEVNQEALKDDLSSILKKDETNEEENDNDTSENVVIPVELVEDKDVKSLEPENIEIESNIEDTDMEALELEKFIDSKDVDENADPMDLVPRSDRLSSTEKKLFSYFSTIPGMENQLVEALADAQMAAADKTSKSGNIIVMGNQGTGKTKLTNALVKAICKELNIEAAKVATVNAEELNDKDLTKIVSKLSGGFLIIEKIGRLIPERVEELDKSMEFRTDGLTVMIEDEKIDMRKFIAKYPNFIKKFTSTINIPIFTNDELVSFAKTYAKEMGYKMDDMGVLALYNIISDNQKEDEPMTIGTVKEMVDDAILKAESGPRKIKRNLAKNRVDEEGRVILYENDFNN